MILDNNSDGSIIRLKRRYSLRWRLLSVLAAMLLLTLLVIGIGVYYFILTNELRTWQRRQDEAAHYAVEVVSAFMESTTLSLKVIGLLDGEMLEERPDLLYELLAQNPTFLEIVRLDHRGRPLASAYRDDPIITNQFTIPQSVWFGESRKGRPYFSSVQISAGSQPYMIISVPVLDGGVVAGRLKMNVLWEVMAGLKFGRSGQAYIVNQAGQIVAHANPEVVLARTDLSGQPQMVKTMASPGQSWRGTYVNFDNVEVIGVTRPVPDTSLIVITEVPTSEVYAISQNALLLLGGGLAGFGLLVLIVTSRFLVRLILQPLEQLRVGALRIGGGDLTQQLNLARRDEVGHVASAFNEMVIRLRDREEALAGARDEALEASQFKSRLLSNVSHDLRTPLGGILGYAEMLQAGVYGPLLAEQEEAVNEIIDSTNQLLALINNLLNQARIEAGKVIIKSARFRPAGLLDDLRSMFGPLAQTKKLEFACEIAPGVPEVVVGDIDALRQVLANLAGNAIKFTEQGRISLRVFCPDSGRWAIRVSDTGPGIPPEAREYIFQAFRQVDGTVTRTHGGSGLGLSIVKQLSVLMRGEVTLESEPGRGSVFTVYLPLAPIEERVT